jgi:hypothetical protein
VTSDIGTELKRARTLALTARRDDIHKKATWVQQDADKWYRALLDIFDIVNSRAIRNTELSLANQRIYNEIMANGLILLHSARDHGVPMEKAVLTLPPPLLSWNTLALPAPAPILALPAPPSRIGTQTNVLQALPAPATPQKTKAKKDPTQGSATPPPTTETLDAIAEFGLY